MLHAVVFAGMALAAEAGLTNPEHAMRFERTRIGEVTFEAAAAIDVNNNGTMDIVSGGVWFEGPDFTTKHTIYHPDYLSEYYDDFSSIPMDVNGNGYTDIVTGGWFGERLIWLENPSGGTGEWTVHEIASVGNVERACFYDIDGDGHPEIIANTPNAPLIIFKLVRDEDGRGTGKFEPHTIREEASAHGIGFGDINGDGRADIILRNGWLEQPENPYEDEWTWRPEFELFPLASVPILVHDVNGDGLNDLIVGNAHDYGLAWWEQTRGEDGERGWVRHDIDPHRSQYHDLQLHDIDNDGNLDLVTGKRWRAHNGNDPGADDPLGVYYFKINGGEFERVTVDYGPAGQASGVGIYFWVADVNGNGYNDIIAPGKEGLFLFTNLGPVDAR